MRRLPQKQKKKKRKILNCSEEQVLQRICPHFNLQLRPPLQKTEPPGRRALRVAAFAGSGWLWRRLSYQSLEDVGLQSAPQEVTLNGTLYSVVPPAGQTCRMREDLPCDESLPTLWSISLAQGGDIVNGGPYLEDYALLETLQRDCWRVRGRRDGNTYVLIETR